MCLITAVPCSDIPQCRRPALVYHQRSPCAQSVSQQQRLRPGGDGPLVGRKTAGCRGEEPTPGPNHRYPCVFAVFRLPGCARRLCHVKTMLTKTPKREIRGHGLCRSTDPLPSEVRPRVTFPEYQRITGPMSVTSN